MQMKVSEIHMSYVSDSFKRICPVQNLVLWRSITTMRFASVSTDHLQFSWDPPRTPAGHQNVSWYTSTGLKSPSHTESSCSFTSYV